MDLVFSQSIVKLHDITKTTKYCVFQFLDTHRYAFLTSCLTCSGNSMSPVNGNTGKEWLGNLLVSWQVT